MMYEFCIWYLWQWQLQMSSTAAADENVAPRAVVATRVKAASSERTDGNSRIRGTFLFV